MEAQRPPSTDSHIPLTRTADASCAGVSVGPMVSAPDLQTPSADESSAAEPSEPCTKKARTAQRHFSAKAAGDAANKVSCMECRNSKVRCSGPLDDNRSTCERCRRLCKECVYQAHRRGRRPKQPRAAALTAGAAAAQASTSLSGAMDQPPAFQPSDSLRASVGNALMAWAHPSDGDQAALGVEAEEADAGLPALSNPLKLLASAGASRLQPATHAALKGTSAGSLEIESHVGSTAQHSRSDEIQQHHTALISFGAATAKDQNVDSGQHDLVSRPHFTFSLYAERLDLDSRLNFIAQPEQQHGRAGDKMGLLDVQEAQMLYGIFMQHVNGPLTLLDPHLHTFEYVRTRSHGLLSIICALAAKFTSTSIATDSNGGSVSRGSPYWAHKSHRLDKHVQNVVLPAIVLDGYRSVELVQALIIAAAFHPPTPSQGHASDRSWTYLGHAIRMGAELDLNGKMLSTRLPAPSPAAEEDARSRGVMSHAEVLHRRLRNRERTWLNCYLFEQSLSAHSGRRPTLHAANDPIVAQADRWHLDSVSHGFRIPEDEAVVAMIQLRRTAASLTGFWESRIGDTTVVAERRTDADGSVAAGAGTGGLDWNEMSREALVESFRSKCDAELGAWRAAWCSDEVSAFSSGLRTADSSVPARLRNGVLYFHYASLLLHSHPLRSPGFRPTILQPSYRAAYTHSTVYLQAFLRTQKPDRLCYAHNSAIVTACYCAIFALRLCEMQSSGIIPPAESFADASAVATLVRRLAEDLELAGKVTAHRQGVASGYAAHLRAVLSSTESASQERGSREQAPAVASADGQHRSTAEHGDDVVPTEWAQDSVLNQYGLEAGLPFDGGDGALEALDRFLTESLFTSHDSSALTLEEWLTCL